VTLSGETPEAARGARYEASLSRNAQTTALAPHRDGTAYENASKPSTGSLAMSAASPAETVMR
jgi:hypothetical protein